MQSRKPAQQRKTTTQKVSVEQIMGSDFMDDSDSANESLNDSSVASKPKSLAQKRSAMRARKSGNIDKKIEESAKKITNNKAERKKNDNFRKVTESLKKPRDSKVAKQGLASKENRNVSAEAPERKKIVDE